MSYAIAHIVKQFVKLFVSTVSRSVSLCAHSMRHHFTLFPDSVSGS